MARTKRRLVVTAGPTFEHIDPVRFLGNESSGKMGFEIARAAAERGDEVVLIAGPVHRQTPQGVRRVDVTSAREMLAELRAAFSEADALFMAAAVADWRPARRLRSKWRAKDGGAERATIELVRNPDLVATVARRKGDRLVVAFALETGRGVARARRKLQAKGADYIVLNDATALGADCSTVTILGRDDSMVRLEGRTKRAIAKRLVRLSLP